MTHDGAPDTVGHALPHALGGLLRDAVGGANPALAMLPKAMAYASVAGVPPVYGLYASCVAPALAVVRRAHLQRPVTERAWVQDESGKTHGRLDGIRPGGRAAAERCPPQLLPRDRSRGTRSYCGQFRGPTFGSGVIRRRAILDLTLPAQRLGYFLRRP